MKLTFRIAKWICAGLLAVSGAAGASEEPLEVEMTCPDTVSPGKAARVTAVYRNMDYQAHTVAKVFKILTANTSGTPAIYGPFRTNLKNKTIGSGKTAQHTFYASKVPADAPANLVVLAGFMFFNPGGDVVGSSECLMVVKK